MNDAPHEEYDFKRQIPKIDLSYIEASSGQDDAMPADEPSENDQLPEQDDEPPVPSGGGSDKTPPTEPPAPPESGESGEDPFERWEGDFSSPQSIPSIHLEPVTTAYINDEGAWETLPDAGEMGEILEVHEGNFAVTNCEFMNTQIYANEYAIVLRDTSSGTDGILRFNKDDLHPPEDEEVERPYTEVLDEKISSVENFSEENTRAIVFAPLPLFGTDEQSIEEIQATQQDAADIQEFLAQKFDGRATVVAQGESQLIGISGADGSIAVSINQGQVVDTYTISEGELQFLSTGPITETPRHLMSDEENVNLYLRALGNDSPWIITPAGSETFREDRDYSVQFDTENPNPEDSSYTLRFHDLNIPIAEARAMVENDQIMYITSLPEKITTDKGDVDLPATLVRRFEVLARTSGCESMKIRTAESLHQDLELEREITGQPSGQSLEDLQKIYNRTAEQLRYTKSSDGRYWELRFN